MELIDDDDDKVVCGGCKLFCDFIISVNLLDAIFEGDIRENLELDIKSESSLSAGIIFGNWAFVGD